MRPLDIHHLLEYNTSVVKHGIKVNFKTDSVVDRDHEVVLPQFMSFMYIYGMRGLFNYIFNTRFNHECFYFT
jgi:hypothetical protein